MVNRVLNICCDDESSHRMLLPTFLENYKKWRGEVGVFATNRLGICIHALHCAMCMVCWTVSSPGKSDWQIDFEEKPKIQYHFRRRKKKTSRRCPRRKCLRVRFEHFTIDFRIWNFYPNKNLFTLITSDFYCFHLSIFRSFAPIQERKTDERNSISPQVSAALP